LRTPPVSARLLWIAAAVLLRTSSLQARVVEADIDSIVSPVTVRVIASALQKAESEHADALLIRLSTPGGFLDATRELIEEILHSPVPVVMWVGPSGARAASAGLFLLEAGDVAAMAPGTNTGASHPVEEGGGQMDAVMKQKVENDTAALMRTVVGRRGRNAAAAEKAVRDSVSYTDREALEQHLIDLIAPTPDALLKEINGREIVRFDGSRQTLHFADFTVERFDPPLNQRILNAIADPNIALLLLVLGALGIYVEFSTPGLVAPGVLGAILVLLGLTALSVFPIDWLGAALIVLAFVFFVLEAKFPTHGFLMVGGAICMVLGATMLIDTSAPELRVNLWTAMGLAIPFALITTFLLSIAVRARRNKVETGVEGMVGLSGVAVGPLDPSGKVLVRGEYWNARAPEHVDAGAPVRITGIQGLTLGVEPLKAEPLKKEK
jgi:membrane-bound serine protease (ClpP class)